MWKIFYVSSQNIFFLLCKTGEWKTVVFKKMQLDALIKAGPVLLTITLHDRFPSCIVHRPGKHPGKIPSVITSDSKLI